jgi:hypothetical protein
MWITRLRPYRTRSHCRQAKRTRLLENGENTDELTLMVPPAYPSEIFQKKHGREQEGECEQIPLTPFHKDTCRGCVWIRDPNRTNRYKCEINGASGGYLSASRQS